LQTHLVSYWVRKRQAFTLEQAVRMPIFDNASAWELPDRGLGAPPTAGRVLNRDG
jgi:N-acyl-D-amino-acid deacylase